MTTCTRTIRDSQNARADRRGFTLAEVLISIGILAAGLTMCAAIFPAGIRENDRSAKNVIGTNCATNGLAVVQAVISNTSAYTLTGAMQIICDNSTNLGSFPLASQAYPTADYYDPNRTYGPGDTACSSTVVYHNIQACTGVAVSTTANWRTGSNTGFVALGRQVMSATGNANIAHIVSIAYRKSGLSSNLVTLQSFTQAVAAGASSFTPGALPTYPQNLTGAILVSDQGEIVKVVAYDSSVPIVQLDHALVTAASSFWVAAEIGAPLSPGVAAVENRIALPVP